MASLEEQVRRLLDIEEIKQLKYRYCRMNDGGWAAQPLSHQGPSHELFTEDGVWDGSPIVVARGRAEIRALFDGYAAMTMAYHAVLNPMIEIDGDTARAHWHLIGAGLSPDGTSVLGMSGYEDEYVRTAEGWRISLMKVIWGRASDLPDRWKEAVPAFAADGEGGATG